MPQDLQNEKSAFVQDDELINKPIKSTVAPERKRDIDLDKTLYDNIIQAGMSSQLDINALNGLNQTAENRNQMYNIYPYITPGIQFIKKLFSHEHAEKAIPYLKLNMPETYWNDTEMFYVYNDIGNYGALTMIKNKKEVKNEKKNNYYNLINITFNRSNLVIFHFRIQRRK